MEPDEKMNREAENRDIIFLSISVLCFNNQPTMKNLINITCCLLIIACTSPSQKEEKPMAPEVQQTAYGMTPDGPATLFTLENANGITAQLTDYGAILVSLKTPDRDENLGEITLGFDNLQGYLDGHPFFGATVGRYGNRIAKGKFSIDGEEYTLATNNNENHLHGGVKGYDKVLWKGEIMEGVNGVAFTYTSPDGEEGYPGTLQIKTTYVLKDDNSLEMGYEATTDKTTHVNLTNHTYFNLNQAETILDHQLTIYADHFTPIDPTLIPIGELRPVEGTPFDFRQAKTIGQDLASDYEQMVKGLGYDHNMVLSKPIGKFGPVATIYEPGSGRKVEVFSEEPGVQFYSGNFLDGTLRRADGKMISKHGAFCLETQHYPDSPNQKEFPSTLLQPGEKYETKTVWRFSAK